MTNNPGHLKTIKEPQQFVCIILSRTNERIYYLTLFVEDYNRQIEIVYQPIN